VRVPVLLGVLVDVCVVVGVPVLLLVRVGV
jgi:hypothetical protein